MAYRLVPVRKPSEDGLSGHVNTSILYDRLMQSFSYGNMADPAVYLDETSRRMIANLRNIFGRLAGELAEEGKNEEAIRVCDRCQELMPDESIRYNFYLLTMAEIYMQAGAPEKGEKLLSRLLELYTQDMEFYLRFPRHKINQLDFEMQQALAVINRVSMVASHYKLAGLETRSASALEKLYNNYLNASGR
jgi:tetratricopeptide (TPR) repeat protein